jgi:hypothetical protein
MKYLLIILALILSGCSTKLRKAEEARDEYQLLHMRCKISSWKDNNEQNAIGRYQRELYMKVCTENAGFQVDNDSFWN